MNRKTFPSTPASVAEARDYVVNAIGPAPRPIVEAAAIAVSELATSRREEGLLLVRALSDDWGVSAPGDRPRKSVWFTMHLSKRTGSALRGAG